MPRRPQAPTLTRSMVERIEANFTELDGSHVIVFRQPEAATGARLKAVTAGHVGTAASSA